MKAQKSLMDMAEGLCHEQELLHVDPFNMSKIRHSVFSTTHAKTERKISYTIATHQLETEYNKLLNWIHQNPKQGIPGSKFSFFCETVRSFYETYIDTTEKTDEHDKKVMNEAVKNCLKLIVWETRKGDHR
jgi:hypothetical protein